MRASVLSVSLTVAAVALWCVVSLRLRVAPHADVRRAVHGVVLTDTGDPLPSVAFTSDGRPLGESNAYGEFCLSLDTEARVLVTAGRPGFGSSAIEVPSGTSDLETLVWLGPPRGARAEDSRRFFVLDALSRGAPELDVSVCLRSSGREVFRGRSGEDGAVYWVRPDSPGPSFDVRVRSEAGAESWSRGLALVADDALPIAPAEEVREFLELELTGTPPADGTNARVLDDTGRTLLWREVRQRRIEGFVARSARLWCQANDGRTAVLRPIPERRGGALTVAFGAVAERICLPASAELVAAEPVLVPSFGAPRVVWGPSLSDVSDGTAMHMPEIPLFRSGNLLVSPALDVVARSFSLRAKNPDEDLRLLAHLGDAQAPSSAGPSSRLVDDARVHRGTASITLRLTSEQERSGPVRVTLARRGGAYASTRLLRAGETTTWSRLSCGAFLLTVERPPTAAVCPGDPAVQEFDDVRRVAVGPGEHRSIDLRLEKPSGTAVLGFRHR